MLKKQKTTHSFFPVIVGMHIGTVYQISNNIKILVIDWC